MTVFEILPDFSSSHSVVKFIITLGVHVIIFIVVLVCLKRFVFSPILATLRIRKKNIDEAEHKRSEIEAKNNVLLEEYRWRMDGAKQLAAERKEVVELIGRRRAEMLLLDVKRETNRDLENIIRSSEAAYAAAAAVIEKDVIEHAEEITRKILDE